MRKAAPLTIAVVLLNGCSDVCSNTVVSRSDAPDGRHSAALFQRDCGATTGFSTQVSIFEVGEQPSGKGNVFRADDDHGVAAAAEWGGPWADIKWLSPTRLIIRYDAKSRIFETDEQVSGVTVSFEKVNR